MSLVKTKLFSSFRSLNYVGILTRWKHRSSSVVTQLTVPKMGKHWNSEKARNKVIKTKNNSDDDLGMDEYEDEDEFETPSFDQIYEEQEMLLSRRQFATRMKMTEKKYFRKKPEPCLLTWAAREQLRYLHHIEPEKWTIEELAKSFPISEEGVKKLLSSNFTLKTPEEIARWDKKVAQKWKGMEMGGGPIKVNLPQKIESEKSLVDINEETVAVKKVGYFSSILSKYSSQPTAGEIKDNLATIIDDFENTRKNKYAHQITADEFLKQNKISPQLTSAYAKNNNDKSNSFKRTIENTESELENLTVTQKYQQEQEIDLKWDTRRQQTVEEAYVYDDKLGYQRPLGMVDKIPEKIVVNPDKVKRGLIKVKDAFYNEEGELLYRVPGLTK